ncbi:RAMP superfamily CRISPR-associated protein [Leptothoe sp. LEGE 181152]|nr:RAMP superfamily CRISPR-associated protein [Leptothoe sp. LEGE 181152]
MHKRLVNHCTISLSIKPDGPILIKSGKEGADPTKPDMEFVETYYHGPKIEHRGKRSIYLPGSSLKGAIRAHAERIVRTIGESSRQTGTNSQIWASDPLNMDDKQNNPNVYLEKWKDAEKKKKSEDRHPNPGAELYKQSCFTSQLFGNTAVASRIRIEDAYPTDPDKIRLEERNGVAIDRVFGSVAVGPFNYQVCTAGEFTTTIHLKNFTLAQLGLIGLVLRDLSEGWFGLGFAKSRGLGTVTVEYKHAVVQYPGCQLQNDGQIKVFAQQKSWPGTALLGVSEFLTENPYGFPENDRDEQTPVAAEPMELGFGVQQTWTGSEQVKDLFRRAVQAWSQPLEVAS